MISRGKISWAFGRLMPHLKWFVLSHPFIETSSKDGLVKQIELLYDTFKDATTRETGGIPLPPSATKERQKKFQQAIGKST